MIVYYDIIADKEIASDSYEQSTPVKGVIAIHGKRITISTDVGIAANADDEAEEGAASEALDDAAQSVINVVYSAKLTQVNLDKKEYKTLQKAYWKKLIDTLNELKWSALGYDTDNAPPTEKAAAAAAEKTAADKLSAYDRRAYDDLVEKIKSYKTNFDALQKFVVDEIIGNFDECEFYTCEDGELGSCMLIAARYVGEATAPTFYIFEDGIRKKKE